MNKEDYEFVNYILDIRDRDGDISSKDLKRLYTLYNFTFNTNVQECFSCASYIKKLISKLEIVKNKSEYDEN